MRESLFELDFTVTEARDLLVAVSSHCTCMEHDQMGTVDCPGHRSLSDESELKRLLFARRMCELWRSGEFALAS